MVDMWDWHKYAKTDQLYCKVFITKNKGDFSKYHSQRNKGIYGKGQLKSQSYNENIDRYQYTQRS